MRRIPLISLIYSFVLMTSAILVDPQDGLELHSDAGLKMMMSGLEYSTSYFVLAQHVNTQISQAFCGVATTAAVLNSFNGDTSSILLPAPPSEASTLTSTYYYFDQTNCFNESQLEKGINASYINGVTGPGGLTLQQLADFMSAWGVTVVATHGGDTDVNGMRSAMINCLKTVRCFITINFLRTSVEELGGGHHTPIGGYDPVSDSFLVLDVAEYKYGNFWFPTTSLYNAINTTDTTVNLTRGFLQVSLDPTPRTIFLQCNTSSSLSSDSTPVIQITQLFLLLLLIFCVCFE